MRVVVPFDATRPKTRLAPLLDADERAAFARAMLEDVLAGLDGSNHAERVEVLATAPVDIDAPVTTDERPLTPAVDDALEGETAVVMADLALATPAAIDRLLATEGDVVLVPGRGGGTNALVARTPGFHVDYHGVSYRDHRRIAREVDADLATVDSYRLSTDVDDPDDLPEVLLHGGARSRAWLRDRGFRLDATEGRVTVTEE